MKSKAVKPIKGKLGKGLLSEIYGGKSFMECLIEIVKNSRDWGATIIKIDASDKDKAQMVIFDNGKGMDEANRSAYVSMKEDVKREGFVSGKFDTGAKFMLFSFADITVRTIAHDDLDTVCIFELKASDYEEKALSNQLEFIPSLVAKNSSTWSYSSQTGTELTLKFRNPTRSSIKRGANLAEELSARLPIKFSEFVLVNGLNIPKKKIKGEVYTIHHEDELLKGKNSKGFLDMELYNPENRRSEDELRLAPFEVGEVTMKKFLQQIQKHASDIPTVYLLDICCGTIVCPFLGEYSDQDRQSFKPDIMSDPRVPKLIQLLKLYAPHVEQAFGIVRNNTMSEAEEADFNDLLEICNEVYDAEVKKETIIKTVRDVNLPDIDTEDDGVRSSKAFTAQPPVSLKIGRHEYEIGESFEVELTMTSSFSKKTELKEFLWNLNDLRSVAKSWSQDRSKVTLVAKQEGNGKISVDLPGTSIQATVHYTIVARRSFRLSRGQITVYVGQDFPVMAINSDKLKGQISWRLTGPIAQLNKYDTKLELKATSPGQATVYAVDSGNPQTSDQCNITVLPNPVKQARTIVIRDKRYLIDRIDAPQDRLVSFHEKIGNNDLLILNFKADNYKFAVGLGGRESLHLLIQQIASEFARNYFINSKVADHRDHRDIKALTAQINKFGDSVYIELMSMFKKKITKK